MNNGICDENVDEEYLRNIKGYEYILNLFHNLVGNKDTSAIDYNCINIFTLNLKTVDIVVHEQIGNLMFLSNERKIMFVDRNLELLEISCFDKLIEECEYNGNKYILHDCKEYNSINNRPHRTVILKKEVYNIVKDFFK